MDSFNDNNFSNDDFNDQVNDPINDYDDVADDPDFQSDDVDSSSFQADQSDAETVTESDVGSVYKFTMESADDHLSSNYTDPWREPTYTPTNDNMRPYSPSHYDSSYLNHEPRNNTKKPKKSSARVVGLVLVCAIICSIFSAASAYLVTNRMLQDYNTSDSNNRNVVIGSSATNNGSNENRNAQSVSVTGETLSAKEIYGLACEQVVGINTSVTTNIFGQTSSSAVSGSGFVISTDGYILTNYHVVEYAATYGYDLSVILHDGTKYDAEIVGYEADNDVAVIKINKTGLHPVTFGSSSDISVGEVVYAIGNPLGELEFSMTSGIVSALDRYVTTDENTSINMFQIDAAVNSGNSGGPVYNSKGEVVGIVTAKYSSTGVEGLGFAIPIDDAVNISTQLIEQGYVSNKAYLGVNAQDINETYSYYLNLPRGAYIYSVVDGSCAQTAGIKIGDVITAVGDYTVSSVNDLKSALSKFSAGDSTNITLYRSGETIQLRVTFDEKAPVTSNGSQNNQSDQNNQYGQYGQGGQSGQGGSYNDFFGNGDYWGYQMP